MTMFALLESCDILLLSLCLQFLCWTLTRVLQDCIYKNTCPGPETFKPDKINFTYVIPS